ncbi:MAG: PAS domain S-box protein [Halobacteriota archaeon]
MEKKARILIVEDEAIVAEDLAIAITDIGYEVVGRAGSAKDAVKKVVELKPDLILMDIVLRGRENGIDASHEIKEKMDIPIIFLTAFSDIELLDSAKGIEPYAYIVKPFQERQLLASIEMALHKSRIEKKLKEREKFSSSLLSNSPNPVIVVNPDTSVRYVNPAMEKLTGFSSAELVGKKAPYPWWTEETTRKNCISLEEAMRKGATKLEAIFQRKNGERFRVEITSTPVRSNDEFRYYLSNWVDITERKRADEEIRKLSSAIEQSIDGIAIGDLEPTLTYVNDAFARMHGYSPEEIIGMNVVNLHNEEQMDEYRRGMNQIKTQGGWVGEIGHIRKDGTPFPTFMSVTLLRGTDGNPTGILAVASDITERKRAEEALKESKERYETLFNSAGEGILIADIETKKVEYANPAICKMLGYSVEELKRMGVSDISPKDKLKHAISEFEALARGEKTLSSDIPCLRKDGTIIYADIDSTKALIDGRECNLGFFRDVTERKRAVEESKHLTLSLREHVKALEESQKKIAKAYRLREHFLKETSHRIITPVAIIGGNSELLLESSNLAEDQKERLRTIRERNEEVQKLVNDALAGKYLEDKEEGGDE